MNNRFVICIGSQRAGSTLLHKMLGESSGVFMHPLKELHYFDTLFGIRPRQALVDFSHRQLYREVDNLITSENPSEVLTDFVKCYVRSNLLMASQEIEAIKYVDLYSPFASNSYLLGEATPEYMLMNAAQALEFKKVVGDDAVIILLCRDPMKRLISSAKLLNAYSGLGMSEEELSQWLLWQIQSNDPWIQFQDRFSDYASSVQVFGPLFKRFVAISFEQLVENPVKVARLVSDIGGFEIDEQRFARVVKQDRVNGLGEYWPSDDQLIALIAARYDRQKQFLNNLFSSS